MWPFRKEPEIATVKIHSIPSADLERLNVLEEALMESVGRAEWSATEDHWTNHYSRTPYVRVLDNGEVFIVESADNQEYLGTSDVLRDALEEAMPLVRPATKMEMVEMEIARLTGGEA